MSNYIYNKNSVVFKMDSDRYEVKENLPNQGGMGLTSIAYDNNLQRLVVIKKLNISKFNPEQIELLNKQLRDEAINQAKLTHPNIAKIYDYYEEKGLGNIVMEYVEGKPISQLSQFFNVPHQTNSLNKALNLIRQVLKGIIYAHQNGIVHRDIKMANIMYNTKNENVKIIDFGLSKIKGQKRDETVVNWHTPGYKPKELDDYRRDEIEKINEEKRDIYALGITIYLILTGEYAYGKPENYSQLTPRISEFRNDISEELDELFYSMIAVEPEERLNDLNLVVDAIRKQLRQGFTPLVKMPNISYHKRIRDAVHGYIKLTKDEIRIIDNRFFQRLRNIKQLGTTYLVYPSAIHSRFEHSLGVMHVATKLFDEITSKNNDILGWDKREIKKQRQMLRLLSLLHDIGHAPFSHVSDNLFRENVNNHETMAAKIIRESELKNIINEIGSKIGNFKYNEIAGLIEGKYLSKYNLIKQIFSGSIIDADRMDYLLRDSYMAGVKYGTYDLDHLIRSIDIDANYENPILAINYRGIYVLEEFILARYYMFNQVYYHKTRRVYDKILEKCIKNYLKANDSSRLPTNVDRFMKIDDHKIMSYIKHYSTDKWNKMFLTRKHYKKVYEIFPRANDRQKNIISELKNRLIKSGIKKDEFIIDEYSQAPLVYQDEEGNPMLGLIGKNRESLFVDKKSLILNKMNVPTYLFRVYTSDSIIGEVSSLIEEVKKDVS